MSDAQLEIEARWSRWLIERNLRGARIVLLLAGFFYPAFAVLDYLVAPTAALPVLYASRVVVTLYTLVMLAAIRMPFAARRVTLLTGLYILVVGAGIGVMIWALGGYRSPYYAGLNLVMLGAGVLFVWPTRVAIVVHGSIVLMYLVPNAFRADPRDLVVALTSFFFLGTTATIAVAAQSFGYRSAHEQVVKQLQLEEATSKLSRTHEELQRLDRFKSRFFANMTHELKTPLAMILSPVELLLEGDLGPLTESQRATLRGVYRNGARLLKLIGDLLDLSRIEESRLRLRIEEHDLRDQLRGLCQQCAPLFERKRIALVYRPGEEAARAWVDLDRMERVFVNLLSNAARFTPVEGRVEVGVEAGDAGVRVWVQDNGPGFPAEQAERVFERFYQVGAESGTARYDKGGTGIGLALAREIVELHGGTIRAVSAPGEGARFEVSLRRGRDHLGPDVIERRTREREVMAERREDPMADFTRDFSARDDFRFLEVATATERRVVERDPGESEHPHTVLVVEDTPDVARLVHMTLRGSMRVFVAPNGEKALALARREVPDLIVTDLMMPVMDGLELTRAVRADEVLRHIPIVMLTARGDLEDRLAGAETGVSAYLAKPFSPRELLATVRAHLRRSDVALDASMRAQMASLETVAAGLAHEINNPLNYIKQSVTLLERELEALAVARRAGDTAVEARAQERIGRYLDTARAGVVRIGGTVAVMQRYAREGFSEVPGPVDLFGLTRDVAAVVGPATGGQVALLLDLQGDGTVSGLGDALQQVVSNLVQNALEAAPAEGGRVRVTGAVEDGHVVLRVADNGPGVPPEDRARVFRPFFTTKEAGRGMGMGLSIVWRVVQAHGGTVTVGASASGGALFTLHLPHTPVA